MSALGAAGAFCRLYGNRPAKRAYRRGFPIRGYVGPNGSGKSAAMVWDAMPTLRAGRPCLSTVRILDFDNPRPCEGFRFDSVKGEEVVCELCTAMLYGAEAALLEDADADLAAAPAAPSAHMQAHPLWIPFTRWDQLLEARGCEVLMDEVTGVASSRESHSMPAPVANVLVQLRRRDVTLSWSAPNWRRSDLIIRECSQAVTYATGFFPKADGSGDRVWRNRRVFSWNTYDAADFEDFTAGKREQLRPMIKDWHIGPRSGVFTAYDTFDAVLSIGTVTEGGTCYTCGGARKRPVCRCDEHGGRAAGAAAEVERAPARKRRSREDGGTPTPAAAPTTGRRRRTDALTDDTPTTVLAPVAAH